MPYANIEATLSPAELTAIEDNIETIKQILPFLVNLTPAERRAAGAFRRQPLAFSTIAAELATQHPELIPTAIDQAAWQRDIALLRELTLIQQRIAQLHEALSDTTLALQSEVARNASTLYNTLKVLDSHNIPGIDAMLTRLKAAHGITRKKKG